MREQIFSVEYVNPDVFAWLDLLWGPHTVDRYADYNNYQLPCFNSQCWNPSLEAVDVFIVNWMGENNWWCPPVSLIPRLLDMWRVARPRKLIVPEWVSHFLANSAQVFKSFPCLNCCSCLGCQVSPCSMAEWVVTLQSPEPWTEVTHECVVFLTGLIFQTRYFSLTIHMLVIK